MQYDKRAAKVVKRLPMEQIKKEVKEMAELIKPLIDRQCRCHGGKTCGHQNH